MNDGADAAIELIYESAVDPTRLPEALQAIADSFGDLGASIAWSRDDGSIGTIVSPSQQAEQRLYEEGGWNARDLRVKRAVERGYFFNGVPFTDRHLCTDEEVVAAPIYAQFLAPLGISWVGAVAVSPDPNLGVLLNVHRSSNRPPFSTSELTILARFGSHLERSLRLGIRLLDAESLKLDLGRALAQVGIGVFALDASRRVTFVNRTGQEMLGDGLAIREDRLVADAPTSRSKLDLAIHNEAFPLFFDDSFSSRPILIGRRADKRPLAVYILPMLPPKAPELEFLSKSRMIVLVVSPESDAPADPAIVRDLLGLTLGEARIAALVGSGLALREAAERLGITEQTARWTLKQVFSKIGVSRQTELALLLSKLTLNQ